MLAVPPCSASFAAMTDGPTPQKPTDLPPPPETPPIPGPSRLVRMLRWVGLALFGLGLVIAVVSGQVSDNEAVRLTGPALGMLGMALYFIATLIRAFQWRR